MLLFNSSKIKIQSIQFNHYSNNYTIDILRLDTIDTIISGNKIFKLQVSIQKAIQKKTIGIVTCGGAYSNHIVATAATCKAFQLKSIGVIRGEQPKTMNHTLLKAKELGMELIFVDRSTFQNKILLQERFLMNGFEWIEEGGYGIDGAEGAKEICNFIDETYTHIICACGTGTTMAGLIKGAKQHQNIIGVVVLKGYEDIRKDVVKILSSKEQNKPFSFMHDYHFGGYAKHPKNLIEYMNRVYQQHQIPTDIVYTGKLVYAVEELVKLQYFGSKAKIMIIHSGGLQGNASLPANTLVF